MRRAKTLVLLDDEVSTGKTFLNLWRALRPHCPGIEHINIVTLTDFMGTTARAALDQALDVPTAHSSAARAEWQFTPKARPVVQGVSPPPYHNAKLKPMAHLGRSGIDRPLVLPKRLLDEVEQRLAIHPRDKSVRIIGTGEFMHVPYLLALHLEHQGRQVSLQSSTRSPILEFGPIQHTQRLDDPYGQGDPYFIYNAPADERQITLILHETELNPAINRFAHALGAQTLSCAQLWPQPAQSREPVQSFFLRAKTEPEDISTAYVVVEQGLLAPSPLAGEGWGEGAPHQPNQMVMPTSPPSPRPSPVKGEGVKAAHSEPLSSVL
jgi:hypothetical protein